MGRCPKRSAAGSVLGTRSRQRFEQHVRPRTSRARALRPRAPGRARPPDRVGPRGSGRVAVRASPSRSRGPRLLLSPMPGPRPVGGARGWRGPRAAGASAGVEDLARLGRDAHRPSFDLDLPAKARVAPGAGVVGPALAQTGITAPVTGADSGERSQATTRDTVSVGVHPDRSALGIAARLAPVSIVKGEMALNRTPRVRFSRASARVSASTAILDTA